MRRPFVFVLIVLGLCLFGSANAFAESEGEAHAIEAEAKEPSPVCEDRDGPCSGLSAVIDIDTTDVLRTIIGSCTEDADPLLKCDILSDPAFRERAHRSLTRTATEMRPTDGSTRDSAARSGIVGGAADAEDAVVPESSSKG